MAQKLTVEQALANIQSATAAFQGNLQAHMTLQESLRVISAACLPKPETVPEKTEVKE